METQPGKRAANPAQSDPSKEQVYSLRFNCVGESSPQPTEFHAANAYQALVIAHREGGGHAAELWSGGKMLCRISEVADSFWEIRPC